MYTYRVKEIVRVIDGDTVDTKIDLGFGITATIRVRVMGVDTPELYGKSADPELGTLAKEFTNLWLTTKIDTLVLQTYKGSADSNGVGDGAFGRWLGTFTDTLTNTSLAEELKTAGLVKISD